MQKVYKQVACQILQKAGRKAKALAGGECQSLPLPGATGRLVGCDCSVGCSVAASRSGPRLRLIGLVFSCAWSAVGVPRLRGRRGGRHSATCAPCGRAAFGMVLTGTPVPCLPADSVLGPPPWRAWHARRLTPAARGTPPSAQAPRGGGAPGSEHATGSVRWRPQRAARRPWCGVPRGARLRRRAWPFNRARAKHTIRRKARHPNTRGPRSESCAPARSALGSAARRRVARSRGAPQRGRRARDSSQRHANRQH